MLKLNKTHAEIRIRLHFSLQKGIQLLEEYANTSHFWELVRQDNLCALDFFFFNCLLGT